MCVGRMLIPVSLQSAAQVERGKLGKRDFKYTVNDGAIQTHGTMQRSRGGVVSIASMYWNSFILSEGPSFPSRSPRPARGLSGDGGDRDQRICDLGTRAGQLQPHPQLCHPGQDTLLPRVAGCHHW